MRISIYICIKIPLFKKNNTANTPEKLTIIHPVNGQISNCLINIINALKNPVK